MKLLGWMHRKLRQNGIEPLKAFTIGNSCSCLSAQVLVDDHEQQHKTEAAYLCQKSSTQLMARKLEEEEEESVFIPEFFHGFLTIGTLGSESITIAPATPTLVVGDREIEVTRTELEQLQNELEKFVEDESNESSKRSSYASIITLSGGCKPMEEYENVLVCPLQGYLFGSFTEQQVGTNVEMKKERTSLGDLFHVGREQSKGAECEKVKKQVKKTHFMKKMINKLHCSSKPASPDVPKSVSNKKKLPKVLRMLSNKVHPETSKSRKQSTTGTSTTKSEKYENIGDNKQAPSSLNQANRVSNRSSRGSREHWIKTDENYLVLEL